ncbi:MAG TPA: FAD-binding protein, partial [Candidatus Limnocylindrales bacterium]
MGGGIWAVGEIGPDGTLSKLSAEVATLARALGAAAGTDATGVVIGAAPDGPARELAGFVPRVIAVTDPSAADRATAVVVAERLAALVAEHDPQVVLTGAGPDGRDIAGVVSALTGRGVLANAVAVRWADGEPVATHSVFGGKLVTDSALAGGRGIVTVRPNSVTAEPAGADGAVESVDPGAPLAQPAVAVVERIEAEGAAVSIDDARIIVAGGRGVGGADGFGLVGDLAEALGGAVGATRAAVDSGWIPYSQQI